MSNTSIYESSYASYLEANKLTDTFANHLEYLKFIREIDSNEIEKNCETIVSDDGSCGCFLAQVSEVKSVADNKNKFGNETITNIINQVNSSKKKYIKNEVEISVLKPKVQEDVFAKIQRTIISLSNDTKIILGGMLVSLVSLVLLICILAFFSL